MGLNAEMGCSWDRLLKRCQGTGFHKAKSSTSVKRRKKTEWETHSLSRSGQLALDSLPVPKPNKLRRWGIAGKTRKALLS